MRRNRLSIVATFHKGLLGLCSLALFLGDQCSLASSSALSPPSPSNGYRMWVASDIHYIAGDLHDQGSAFQGMLENSDNKNTEMTDPLLDTLLWSLTKDPESGPACLVLTGDMTFNGARASHLAFATRLRAYEAAGIPVYVLPGNHDLSNPYSRSYVGDESVVVDTVTASEFAKIYDDFGFHDALSRDDGSLSYIVQPCVGLRLLMLDTTTSSHNMELGYASVYGHISSSTRKWIEERAKEAVLDHCRLVVAMHHSLLDHNPIVNDGYTIDDSAELAELFTSLGIHTTLTGHTHIQDIVSTDTVSGCIYDITTGALSVFPHNCGLLAISPKGQALELSYTSHRLDVSAWARSSGSEDSRLLEFGTWSKEFFDAHSVSSMSYLLDAASCSEEGINQKVLTGSQRARFIDYLVRLNARFFAGEDSENDIADLETGTLLCSLFPESFVGPYALSICTDVLPGDNELVLP